MIRFSESGMAGDWLSDAKKCQGPFVGEIKASPDYSRCAKLDP
jgi:hypothetical protein